MNKSYDREGVILDGVLVSLVVVFSIYPCLSLEYDRFTRKAECLLT